MESLLNCQALKTVSGGSELPAHHAGLNIVHRRKRWYKFGGISKGFPLSTLSQMQTITMEMCSVQPEVLRHRLIKTTIFGFETSRIMLNHRQRGWYSKGWSSLSDKRCPI